MIIFKCEVILVNRDMIFKFAAENFGARPEYLWEKYPDYAVFRRSDNNKWFAVIMNITKDKLGLDSKDEIDIIDLKCDPLMIGSARISDGVFPAYHMNKDHWITILLDGTAEDELIYSHIALSYELAGGKNKKK